MGLTSGIQEPHSQEFVVALQNHILHQSTLSPGMEVSLKVHSRNGRSCHCRTLNLSCLAAALPLPDLFSTVLNAPMLLIIYTLDVSQCPAIPDEHGARPACMSSDCCVAPLLWYCQMAFHEFQTRLCEGLGGITPASGPGQARSYV